MSEFYSGSSFLELSGYYAKYYSITSSLNSECKEIEGVLKKLRSCEGFGIENQIRNLENTYNQLVQCKNDVVSEWQSIKRISDVIGEYENKAYGILSGNSSDGEMIEYSYDEDSVTIKRDDWKKLIDQFKYYSTRNDATKEFYEWLQKFYSLDKDIIVSREFYDEFKTLFNSLIHKDEGAAYSYSNIEYLSKDGTTSSKAFQAKADGEITGIKAVQAYGIDGDTVEYTLKIAGVSGEASAGIEMPVLDKDQLENLQKALSSTKSNEEAKIVLTEFGFKIKGEFEGIAFDVVTTRKINDNYSVYDKVSVTVGEAYAKASVLDGEFNSNNTGSFTLFEAGAGVSVAKIESTIGIKTSNGIYAIKGGLNAGVEWALKFGNESEIEVAFASIGLVLESISDNYIWL